MAEKLLWDDEVILIPLSNGWNLSFRIWKKEFIYETRSNETRILQGWRLRKKINEEVDDVFISEKEAQIIIQYITRQTHRTGGPYR